MAVCGTGTNVVLKIAGKVIGEAREFYMDAEGKEVNLENIDPMTEEQEYMEARAKRAYEAFFRAAFGTEPPPYEERPECLKRGWEAVATELVDSL